MENKMNNDKNRLLVKYIGTPSDIYLRSFYHSEHVDHRGTEDNESADIFYIDAAMPTEEKYEAVKHALAYKKMLHLENITAGFTSALQDILAYENPEANHLMIKRTDAKTLRVKCMHPDMPKENVAEFITAFYKARALALVEEKRQRLRHPLRQKRKHFQLQVKDRYQAPEALQGENNE
jgi:hypothetical protein